MSICNSGSLLLVVGLVCNPRALVTDIRVKRFVVEQRLKIAALFCHLSGPLHVVQGQLTKPFQFLDGDIQSHGSQADGHILQVAQQR